jgi:exonuclease III
MINLGQMQRLTEGFLLPPTQLLMMKIITWNIRGLNGRSKQRILEIASRQRIQTFFYYRKPNVRGKWQRNYSKYVGVTVTSYTQTQKGSRGFSHPLEPSLSHPGPGLFNGGHAYNTLPDAIGSNKEGVITNAYGPQISQEKDHFLNNLAYIEALIGQK